MFTSLKSAFRVLSCCGVLALSLQSPAQSRKYDTTQFEAGGGYLYEHSNAPAGSCGCFSLNGGFAAFAYNAPHAISLVADVAIGHTGKVAASTQSITYVNYLVGPRYSLRRGSDRFIPYGQFLIGGSHESSSVAQANGLNAFALSAGGGAALRLSPHVGLTLLEADWLHSQLFNGSNNRQNALELSAGINVRFGKKQGK